MIHTSLLVVYGSNIKDERYLHTIESPDLSVCVLCPKEISEFRNSHKISPYLYRSSFRLLKKEVVHHRSIFSSSFWVGGRTSAPRDACRTLAATLWRQRGAQSGERCPDRRVAACASEIPLETARRSVSPRIGNSGVSGRCMRWEARVCRWVHVLRRHRVVSVRACR